MSLFQRSQISVIGLDLGPDVLRAIQLDHAGPTLKVRASAETTVPVSASLIDTARLARQLIQSHPFRGKRITVNLPREIVYVRHMRVALTSACDLHAAIQTEARGVLPFDPADAQLRYIPTCTPGQNFREQDVILFAARHADVDDFISEIDSAGLQLNALDVEPCATFRAVNRLIRKQDSVNEVHVILTVSGQHSEVAIGLAGDMKLLRTINIGVRHFHEAISRQLGVGMDEAQSLRRRLSDQTVVPGEEEDAVRAAASDATRGLVEDIGREIARCIRYYAVTFRGYAPSIVRVTGVEVDDPQFLADLTRLLAIPVELANPPFKNFGPAWMAACGLALNGAPPDIRQSAVFPQQEATHA